MKKYIMIRLIWTILFSVVVLILVSALLQLKSAEDKFVNSASLQIEQMIEILEDNEAYSVQLEEDLTNEYQVLAKAAAYMIDKDESVILSSPDLQEIASLLSVDELHIMDKEGLIYAGTVPEYFGYSLDSGEQMEFFLPMLEDTELSLIQEITPNTAEGREMMYVAVWGESKEYIVQIGIEPTRLLEALQATEMEYWLSRLALPPENIMYAVDSRTGMIVSATEQSLINTHVTYWGISEYSDHSLLEKAIPTTILGIDGKTVFLEFGDIYIGLNESNRLIHQFAFENVLVVVLSGIVISTLVIIMIYYFIDSVLMQRFHQLRAGMERITGGDLDYKMQVTGLPEFEVLSEHVNTMVGSIVETSSKFSTIFQYVDLPIAIYENRAGKVTVTSKMREILEYTEKGMIQRLIDGNQFMGDISKIMLSPYEKEADVFIYRSLSKKKYLRIRSYSEETNNWGIIMDVTEEIKERTRIKQDQNMDPLVSMWNRTGFLDALAELEQKKETIKKAAMLVLNLEQLKYVNDTWGFSYSEQYIAEAAQCIKGISCATKIEGRVRGGEFILLLYGAETYEELEAYLKGLQVTFGAAFVKNPKGERFPIVVSAGYSYYPLHTKKLKTMLELADDALWEAKQHGEARFELWSEEFIMEEDSF